MNVTYVSALYNIYNSASVSERLSRDVADLLIQPIKLIMFVDDFYATVVASIPKSKTVTVVKLAMEDLRVYNMIVKNKRFVQLPLQKTPEKDTHEYMALMSTKIEFLDRALSLTDSQYLAWIDAGTSKMFKDKSGSFAKLARAKFVGFTNVLIPGCYVRKLTFSELCKNVWWVFLGTFFVCHRDFVSTFYNRSLQTVTKFLINKYISWEVNLWVDLMQNYPDVFEWYSADHNDCWTDFPPQFLEI